jgi:TonB family protein
VSLGAHIAAAVLVSVVARHAAATVNETLASAHEAPPLVWLAAIGSGGGGGGGGDRSPYPPRRAEKPGADRLTVNSAPARSSPLTSEHAAIEERRLAIDAEPLASGTLTTAGSITGLPDVTARGPGTGAGAGGNTGSGDGAGQGPGAGTGRAGGCCEGAFRPGDGVSPARVIHQVRPGYTSEALRARIQGAVWLEFVVMPDGTVGGVRVMRSLDSRLGLDEEAIQALKQWRFLPGTRDGTPVPVVATIELTFSIH